MAKQGQAPPATGLESNSASDASRRRALVAHSPGLQPYGTPDEIVELIRRFKVMLPETKDMTADEVVALAQVAYVHGLNPLPAVREVMWIPGKGAMVGIRGLRRKGRDWAEAHNLGIPDLQIDPLIDPVLRERERIPKDALAYVCQGGFPTARATWVQDAVKLREALGPEAPYEVILATIGPIPQYTGYGYVTIEEIERLDNAKWWHECKAQNGRKVPLFGMDPCPDCGYKSYAQPPAFGHAARGRKRAEAHWWKQAADLPFAVTPDGGGFVDIEDVPLEVIEGSFTESTRPPITTKEAENASALILEQMEREKDNRTPGEIKEAAAKGAETLWGTPNPRTWPSDFVAHAKDLLVHDDIIPHDAATKHVIMLLNLGPFGPTVSDADLVGFYRIYRSFRDQDMGSNLACTAARKQWFETEGKAPF